MMMPAMESLERKNLRSTMRIGDISFMFLSRGVSPSASSAIFASDTSPAPSAASSFSSSSSLSISPLSLSEFDARVDHRIHQISEQHAQNGQAGEEHIVRHDDGDIPLLHGIQCVAADTGEAEHLLGDHRAAEERRDQPGEAGDERDHRVAESVLIDDLPFVQPLCAGRADIIGVEDFEHIRPRHPHARADAQNDDGEDGENHMPHIVSYCRNAGEGRTCRPHARNGEPAELVRKDIFEHPQHTVTKRFVRDISSKIDDDKQNENLKKIYPNGILLRLTFDEDISRQPIVSRVMKETTLDISIVSGNLTNTIDSSFGVLIVNVLGGTKQDYENIIQKFQDYHVIVEVI